MDPWQWIEDIEVKAREEGDVERMRLLRLYMQAHGVSNDLPQQRLALFEQGRELAKRLREPWWALYFEHWVVETLLYGTQQPQLALDRIVRAIVEARKPIYNSFPQRSDLHLVLIGAYLSVDPIGYEKQLRQALDHVEEECEGSLDKRAYFAQLKGYFLETVGDAEAIDVAWDYLQRAEEANSEHFQWDALYLLCSTLYRFQPDEAREQVGDIARFGEEVARREERNRGVASFLMWRAVAARWAGDEIEAANFYRRAVQIQAKVPPPRTDIHFAAIVFHRAGNEWDEALRACQQSLRILRQHGLTFLEVQRRYDKCCLLKDMGRDWSRDATRLLSAASSLVSKAHWEQKVADLGENH